MAGYLDADRGIGGGDAHAVDMELWIRDAGVLVTSSDSHLKLGEMNPMSPSTSIKLRSGSHISETSAAGAAGAGILMSLFGQPAER